MTSLDASRVPANESSSDVSVAVPARACALCALATIVAVLGCRWLGSERPAAAGLELVLAGVAVGVVPGAVTVLAWRPRLHLTVVEVLGFGIAVSFALVQLLTIVAVSLHVSPTTSLTLLLTASAVAAVVIARRSPAAIVLSLDDVVVLALMCVIGVFLYLLGSPVSWWEDQVHVAVVRRLSALESPRLDNLYFAPGVAYTYPFPGIHYFVALVARLSDLDPLFVYQKLRFFWGPAALAMLHLAARAIFGRNAIGTAVTVTAALLVCAGAFAMVPGFSSGWGQLVPFSHASDVAMTVLLPALLVVAFEYVMAPTGRERAFFLTSTVVLTLMMTMVHIREVVQFSVYLGGFSAVTLVVPGLRVHARRAAVLVALVLTIVPLYAAWQAGLPTQVDSIVGEQRQRLVEVALEHTLWDLITGSAPTLFGGFVPNAPLTFGGLMPLGLMVAPVMVVLFRRQLLVWLVVPATALYLAIMSASLLAFGYIYLTYFEILYSPVRNVAFFVYLFTGAFVYMSVVGLAHVDRTRLSLPVAGLLVGSIGVLAGVSVNQSGSGFFLPLIGACVAAGVLASDQGAAGTGRGRIVLAAVLAVGGAILLWPEREPAPLSTGVGIEWRSGLPESERVTLERRFHLTQGEREPGEREAWRYRLTDLSSDNVRSLVRHQEVAETDEIDRDRFTVRLEPPADVEDLLLGARLLTALTYPNRLMFVGMAVAAWALAFVAPLWLASSRGRSERAIAVATATPFHRSAVPYVLFMLPFAVLTARPAQSPLLAGVQAGTPGTPAAALGALPCLELERRPAPFTDELPEGRSLELPPLRACMPSVDVVAWVREHLPVESVLAINRWNPVFLPLVLPQQIVVFPGTDRTLERERDVFDRYYQFYVKSLREYGVQPLFNTVETPAERAAFIEALGVTHVLIDPASFDELLPVFDGLPEQFTRRHVQDRWAVYEVTDAVLGRR